MNPVSRSPPSNHSPIPSSESDSDFQTANHNEEAEAELLAQVEKMASLAIAAPPTAAPLTAQPALPPDPPPPLAPAKEEEKEEARAEINEKRIRGTFAWSIIPSLQPLRLHDKTLEEILYKKSFIRIGHKNELSIVLRTESGKFLTISFGKTNAESQQNEEFSVGYLSETLGYRDVLSHPYPYEDLLKPLRGLIINGRKIEDIIDYISKKKFFMVTHERSRYLVYKDEANRCSSLMIVRALTILSPTPYFWIEKHLPGYSEYFPDPIGFPPEFNIVIIRNQILTELMKEAHEKSYIKLVRAGFGYIIYKDEKGVIFNHNFGKVMGEEEFDSYFVRTHLKDYKSL